MRNKQEFVDYVKFMELQNLSGREESEEAFEIGIAAAYDQITEDFREVLIDFADYSESDKVSTATDECVDNYLDNLLNK